MKNHLPRLFFFVFFLQAIFLATYLLHMAMVTIQREEGGREKRWRGVRGQWLGDTRGVVNGMKGRD